MALAGQDAFARALLDRAHAIPAGMITRSGASLDRCFAVHRTNVLASLTGALVSRFPATERIVGSAFFAAMAAVYIDRHPPRSPVLLGYGNDLAAFVEGFEPAAGVPYLADVIRLEAARGTAYHAADEPPLDPGALALVSPADLEALTFTLHPAAVLIRSRHPVVTIWAMNTGAGEPTPLAAWAPEDALVTRPHLTVQVRALPVGGGVFLSSLAAGDMLGTAAEITGWAVPEFDLTASLAGLLQAGALAACSRAAGRDTAPSTGRSGDEPLRDRLSLSR